MKTLILLRIYVLFVVTAMLFGCHEDPAEPVVPTTTPIVQTTPLPSATPTISADESASDPAPTPQPTGTPVSTPTPQATGTPVSMPTPHPTWTPFVMPTPQPTWTPFPISTPLPTPPPQPTWAPVPTSLPTSTPVPKLTPTPVPTLPPEWQVVYQLPHPVGCCKVNCVWSGVGDCLNSFTRTISINIVNAAQIKIEGEAEAKTDTCYANGQITAVFSDGSTQSATIRCQSRQNFQMFFDFGGQRKTGSLILTMGVSDWCLILHSLTVSQK